MDLDEPIDKEAASAWIQQQTIKNKVHQIAVCDRALGMFDHRNIMKVDLGPELLLLKTHRDDAKKWLIENCTEEELLEHLL